MNYHFICLNIHGSIEVDTNGVPIYGTEQWQVLDNEPCYCGYCALEFGSWADAKKHCDENSALEN